MGGLAVNQCEVTYVNHIEQSDAWERHGQVERLFRNWSPLSSGVFLPEPEDVVSAVAVLYSQQERYCRGATPRRSATIVECQ